MIIHGQIGLILDVESDADLFLELGPDQKRTGTLVSSSNMIIRGQIELISNVTSISISVRIFWRNIAIIIMLTHFGIIVILVPDFVATSERIFKK
jgi:hypothetical protein